jgi:hypothetical protein
VARRTNEPRPRDHADTAEDVARELSEIASRLAGIKGEAMNWLRDPNLYGALRIRLENAHAAVEAAAVEARRRVRLNDEDEPRRGNHRKGTPS